MQEAKHPEEGQNRAADADADDRVQSNDPSQHTRDGFGGRRLHVAPDDRDTTRRRARFVLKDEVLAAVPAEGRAGNDLSAAVPAGGRAPHGYDAICAATACTLTLAGTFPPGAAALTSIGATPPEGKLAIVRWIRATVAPAASFNVNVTRMLRASKSVGLRIEAEAVYVPGDAFGRTDEATTRIGTFAFGPDGAVVGGAVGAFVVWMIAVGSGVGVGVDWRSWMISTRTTAAMTASKPAPIGAIQRRRSDGADWTSGPDREAPGV
jgi:hypothetical protein